MRRNKSMQNNNGEKTQREDKNLNGKNKRSNSDVTKKQENLRENGEFFAEKQ